MDRLALSAGRLKALAMSWSDTETPGALVIPASLPVGSELLAGAVVGPAAAGGFSLLAARSSRSACNFSVAGLKLPNEKRPDVPAVGSFS